MIPIRSYRDLIVWQKAMALAALCYAKTVELMKAMDTEQILEMTEEVGKLVAIADQAAAEGSDVMLVGRRLPYSLLPTPYSPLFARMG